MPNLRPPLDPNGTPFATQIIQGAATPLDHKKRNSRKPTVYDWQHKAYDYYDEIPEVYYGANFIGNCMARILLVGAEVNSDLAEAPKITKKEIVKEAVRNFKNSRSGQAGLLRRSGQNMFLAGELYVHGDEDEDGEQEWEVYSPLELIDDGTSYTLQVQSGEEATTLPRSSMITRVWKEHPRRSFDADSAMRTCQSQCEKLLTLEKQDMSIARSRFAGSGLLLFPAEIIPVGVVDDEGNIDDDPNHSPFIQGIQASMIEPILGTELPEDVVPSFVVGQADYLKEIRHFTMEKPLNAFSEEQKMAAVRRMATAMDLPNEVLLGMADTNHWTAWQIKEETFQTHIRPFVEMMCNSLTVAYLWPALKKLDIKDYKKYIVWYDDTNLVARPDKTQAAQKAYEAIAISGEAYRREYGFSEDDAPSEEEFNKRAGLSMRDSNMAATGKPSQDQNNTHDAQGPYAQDKSRPDPNLPGPAKSPVPGTAASPAQVSSNDTIQASAACTLSPQTLGYLEASIDRALEKAGAKVRTLFPKGSEVAQYAKGFSNEELYAKLDSTVKAQYGIKDDNFLDFEPAVNYLKINGANPTYDFDALKAALRSEALRKANSTNGSFSINSDNLPL